MGTAEHPLTVTAPRPGIDVHQHLWPPALVEALRARGHPPRLRGWTLELDGEPDYRVDPSDHDPAARAALARADGLRHVLVSLSSPLGIESLPADEGAELLAAWHEGALALGPPFRTWAAASLSVIDPAALQRELDRGCVGLQLPATAVRDADGYAAVAPLLDVLAARDRPLFIHPGPAACAGSPPWWPAVVDYVAQMHAAWFAFAAFGREAHPGLRVVFAMLAGLAPLHAERVAARAGGAPTLDRAVFLEPSSYGPRAIGAVAQVTGTAQLVHGSDRPYATPPDLSLTPDAKAATGVLLGGG